MPPPKGNQQVRQHEAQVVAKACGQVHFSTATIAGLKVILPKRHHSCLGNGRFFILFGLENGQGEQMHSNEYEPWDLEIEPSSGFFDLNWREVWQYRDLITLFVRRDIVATSVWNYFQECLVKTYDTLISNQNLFGKVYFPRLAAATVAAL